MLNPDVIGYIYSLYYKNHVMDQLVKEHSIIWSKPSTKLQELCCKDIGAIQKGSDLEDLIPDHKLDLYYRACIGCPNCSGYNFPCSNCCNHIFENSIPCEIFKLS